MAKKSTRSSQKSNEISVIPGNVLLPPQRIPTGSEYLSWIEEEDETAALNRQYRPKEYNRVLGSTETSQGNSRPEVRRAAPTTYSQFVSPHESSRLEPHPKFQSSYDRGYESRYSQQAGISSNSGLDGSHNGILSFEKGGKRSIPLFITDVMTTLSLSGVRAQSSSGSVFYPRNFNQTSLVLVCQAPTQLYYGKVMEAIRRSHSEYAELSHLSVTPSRRSNTFEINGILEDIVCDGYITEATRKHSRHEMSPTFEIGFTVSQFYSPSKWADGALEYTLEEDWHALVLSTKDSAIDFEPPPPGIVTGKEKSASAEKARAQAKKGAKNGAKSEGGR